MWFWWDSKTRDDRRSRSERSFFEGSTVVFEDMSKLRKRSLSAAAVLFICLAILAYRLSSMLITSDHCMERAEDPKARWKLQGLRREANSFEEMRCSPRG